MANIPPVGVQAQFLSIFHRAFVQARNLALTGDCKQLYELADTFEILPELMTRWDESALERIRAVLAEYEIAHPNCGYEYLSLLDDVDTAVHPVGFNKADDRD